MRLVSNWHWHLLTTMHEQLTQNSKYLPFSSGFVCRKCIFAVVLVGQRAIYVVSKDSYARRLVPHPLLNTWYLFETRHSFLAQCNLPPHLNETGIYLRGRLSAYTWPATEDGTFVKRSFLVPFDSSIFAENFWIFLFFIYGVLCSPVSGTRLVNVSRMRAIEFPYTQSIYDYVIITLKVTWNDPGFCNEAVFHRM